MAHTGNNSPDGNNENLMNARAEDIKWISSLSEPEIDFLVNLKELAIRRAKNVGYKDLGDKFDLRMLRALGSVLLEYFKDRIRSNPEIQDAAEMLRLLNECGLSLPKGEGSSASNSHVKVTDDLSLFIPRRKRMWDGLCEDSPKRYKRQRTADTDDDF